LNTFSEKTKLNRHEQVCKFKDDPVRLLEIEKKIKVDLPDNKSVCRFCNVNFCRTSNLNKHFKVCKEREVYYNTLKTDHSSQTFIENQTINNVTNNNNLNIVLNFGEENTDHITTEDIIGLLKDARSEYPPEEFSMIAGELIFLFDKLIKENPINRNISIPCLNSMYAKVKYERGWEMLPIDKVVHRLIKNSSMRLLEHRKEIEELDRKYDLIGTVQNTPLRIAPNIFKEVNELSSRGIITSSTKFRTGLKLNNLEN